MKKHSKKPIKKQIIIGSAVAAVLIVGGTTAGVVSYNNAVHAQQVAVEKKAEVKKEAAIKAENALEAKATAALLVAEKNDNINNVSVAQSAVNALKAGKAKTAGNKEIDAIHARIVVETAAKNAVATLQKDASNTTKQKSAQDAVNKLTNSYDKDLKNVLNKQIQASVAQAQAAKAVADAKVKADADAAAAQAQASKASSQTDTNNYASGYSNASDNSVSTGNTGGASASSDSGYSAGTSSTGGGAAYTAPAQTPAQAQSSPATPSAPPAPATPSSPSTGGAANPNKSIDELDKQEQDAGNSSNHFPGGW